MSASVHVPVMLREVLQQLDLKPGLTVVDGTVGAGGHSQRISEQIGESGILVGLDRDSMMLNFATERVSGAGRHLIQSSYSEIQNVLNELGIDTVDRILLDLGLSSDQLVDRQRGFGYSVDAPLDMRFDNRSGKSVAEFLDNVDQTELTEILTTYGEEKFSEAIAQRIVERRRRKQPIRTTRDLTETVEEAIPARFRQQSRKDPSTRVFQALRIAVNQELTHLEQALQTELYEALAPGGRLSIITFHSLEDRLVKNAFRDDNRWKVLAKKPTAPTPAEVRMNPRSRSAKLRTAAKL
ncbi:MAG: 16S rRNA (cytosine1402-N4)-methyltransferase [Planctomycetaceae bacterium]